MKEQQPKPKTFIVQRTVIEFIEVSGTDGETVQDKAYDGDYDRFVWEQSTKTEYTVFDKVTGEEL